MEYSPLKKETGQSKKFCVAFWCDFSLRVFHSQALAPSGRGHAFCGVRRALYLLYVALRHHVRDVTLYFSVAFIILFLGTVDEIIQWLVPERFWDFRDVWLNFLSGGLFQVALWKGFQPKNIVEKVTARSIQILSVAIAASLLLLGLCFSFTPPRIGWITEKLPFLSLLKENENMMSERVQTHGS